MRKSIALLVFLVTQCTVIFVLISSRFFEGTSASLSAPLTSKETSFPNQYNTSLNTSNNASSCTDVFDVDIEGHDLSPKLSVEEQNSFLHTISRFEAVNKEKITDRCSQFGGEQLMKRWDAAEEIVCSGEGSRIAVKSVRNNDDIYSAVWKAENVSFSQTYSKDGELDALNMHTQCSASFNAHNADVKLANGFFDKGKKTVLLGMMKNLPSNAQRELKCNRWVEHTLFIMDSRVDTWNLWWYLTWLYRQFLFLAVAKPETHVQVIFTGGRERTLVEAVNLLFSDNTHKARFIYRDSIPENLCFRHVIWSPNINGCMLRNNHHAFSSCYLSTVAAFRAHLRASLHVPTVSGLSGSDGRPNILFVTRQNENKPGLTGWQKQRLISNQDEVVDFVREKCMELEYGFTLGDFWGDNAEASLHTQGIRAAQSNILIGVHGAGMNFFLFMPPQSVVVEMHFGTSANQNSRNTVNHVGGGYVVKEMGQHRNSARQLDKQAVWNLLRQGIDQWFALRKQETVEV